MAGISVRSLVSLALAIAMGLAGCGLLGACAAPGAPGAEAETPVALAIVVGNHKNAKPYNLDAPEVTDEIYRAVCTRGYVSIIVADGAPAPFAGMLINGSGKIGLTQAQIDEMNESITQDVLAQLRAARAQSPEVDTLEAISVAVRSLSAAPENSEKRLLVIDTGLSTAGYLNFAAGNAVEASPEAMARQLDERAAIPPLTDIGVRWVGLGDTQHPQAALSKRQLGNLRQIWAAVLARGGAAGLEILDTLPLGGESEGSLPGVTCVPLLAEPPVEGQAQTQEPILFGEQHIRFIADTADYADPAAVARALRETADMLCENPASEFLVVGATASGRDEERCLALSRERAQRVCDTLAELGAAPGQLRAVGLGSADPWHLEDLNSDGTHNENAPANRKVVIVPAGHPLAAGFAQARY